MDEDEDAVGRFIAGVTDVARWSKSNTISFQNAETIQQPFLVCDEWVKPSFKQNIAVRPKDLH